MLNTKRILMDIKKFENANLGDSGIYLNYNEEDLSKMKLMIVGPDETPYQGGFYLFDVTFTDNYPFSPPKVLFVSYSQTARMNPNLYTGGKVCLSILGTWKGPPWTPMMNIISLALDLQIRLNKNPLQNEPGYENDTENLTPLYNRFIEYNNIEISVIKTLNDYQKLPKSFFIPIKKEFLKHYEYYKNYIENIQEKEGETISCPYASSKAILKPKILKPKLDLLYKNISDIKDS
jgi:ubiquitin-conjugating enzyme E2 Z